MDCIFTELIESPIGPLIAGATSEGVCLLEFSERRRLEKQFNVLRRRFALPILPGSNKHLEHLKQELTAYFRRYAANLHRPPGLPRQRLSGARLGPVAAHPLW